LWRNQQIEEHLVLKPKPRNHCNDFEAQIIKLKLPVLKPKSGNPPPPWFWGSTKKLTTVFKAKPRETIVTSFEAKLEKTIPTSFEAKLEKTAATDFEAKPEKTIITSFEAKPPETDTTGFEAQTGENRPSGFEAKCNTLIFRKI
jgi:hypothetical protein